MNNNFYKRSLFILFIFLVSCEYLYTEQITGRYYLVGNSKHDVDISYKVDEESFVGVIDNSIIAVGYNDKYIIVKQKDYERIIQYYIVPIYNEFTYFPDKGVIGPLTLEVFTKKRIELNIGDEVEFKKTD